MPRRENPADQNRPGPCAACPELVHRPDQPWWLEHARCKHIQREKQLDAQDATIDQLERKLQDEDLWLRQVYCLMLASPFVLVGCCCIGAMLVI